MFYKAIKGSEPTVTTLFTKLFKGENQHLPHYLQSYLRERTNNYHIIYKTILGREPTFTTLFTNYLRGRINIYRII